MFRVLVMYNFARTTSKNIDKIRYNLPRNHFKGLCLVQRNKNDNNSKKKKRACKPKGATPLSRSSLTAAFLKMKPQNWGFLENNNKA